MTTTQFFDSLRCLGIVAGVVYRALAREQVAPMTDFITAALIGITVLALLVAAGLIIAVAWQANTSRQLREDLAKSNRRGYDLAEANARLRQTVGPPRWHPATGVRRPRMERPGPPAEPTVELSQTQVQANHGGAT